MGSPAGQALSGTGLDLTKARICLLEDRIAADGISMIWLLINGMEIGPLIQYCEGGTNKNTTSDCVGGKDFSFSCMGTSTGTVKAAVTKL